MSASHEGPGCHEAQAAFSQGWDGQLAGEALRRLNAHLAGCANCRREKRHYDAALDELGPALARLVEGERPKRGFPEHQPRPFLLAANWLRPAALALSALAVGFIAIDHQRRGLVLPPPPVSLVAGATEIVRPCPWHVARPEDVSSSVSYRVMADPCLDAGFELVEARVRRGRACEEGVQLTYRSGSRTLVLEQHPEESRPAACPADRIVMDRVAGCLEHGNHGSTALVWSLGRQGYRLEGDVAPGEAVAVARSIAESLGEP